MPGPMTSAMEQIWLAWRHGGPCTIVELSQRTGMEEDRIRQRTFELRRAGRVRVAPQPGAYGAGRAAWFEAVPP